MESGASLNGHLRILGALAGRDADRQLTILSVNQMHIGVRFVVVDGFLAATGGTGLLSRRRKPIDRRHGSDSICCQKKKPIYDGMIALR